MVDLVNVNGPRFGTQSAKPPARKRESADQRSIALDSIAPAPCRKFIPRLGPVCTLPRLHGGQCEPPEGLA